MEEEFVPYELALRLKELGFDKSTFGGWCHPFNNHKPYLQLNQEGEYDITAPTFSQAFRWFREKYDINNCISYSRLEDNNWYYQYYKSGLDGGFKTYEEAELACLEKLLEIVETKSE